MLPAYYTEISEVAEIVAHDPSHRIEEIAFLKARLARGSATEEEISHLLNLIMSGE